MIFAKCNAKSSSISAVITRADGAVENLGIISYWHKNPLKRWAFNALLWLKARIR